MALTQIFSYLQPRDDYTADKLKARQKEIVEGLADILTRSDLEVLRVLNEYAEIGKLGERFHSREDCLGIYGQLLAAGYEENVQGEAHFDPADSEQIACYLIGQALEDLKNGYSPAAIFVTRSSLALNGVPHEEWQNVINREILMI